MAWGKKSSNLYLMQASIAKGIVNVIENKNLSKLWYQRLSHMSAKGFDCLAKNNILSRVKSPRLDRSAHCLVGKQIRI